MHELQYAATRMRERPVIWSLLIVLTANVAVLWVLATRASAGAISVGALVAYAQCVVGTSLIAFGGFSWALDGASAPVAAVLRLEKAMAPTGSLTTGSRSARGLPAGEIRFRGVRFTYPRGGAPVLDGVDLAIPAGSSLAIVGQNGAGKTTLAKLLCRLYDPAGGCGRSRRRGHSRPRPRRVARPTLGGLPGLRTVRAAPARQRRAAGRPDETIREALATAGGGELAGLDTILSRAYDGGTDLSGGQWQRIALARALCAVAMGAGVVLLDEPTAQLDVRGEAEIFERILAATRHCTTILVSHRFSTVRHADRICVLEHGRVVELGTHDELMAANGRYRTMFDLQAQRFGRSEEDEGVTYDVLG